MREIGVYKRNRVQDCRTHYFIMFIDGRSSIQAHLYNFELRIIFDLQP
jgi:hypothetical protein